MVLNFKIVKVRLCRPVRFCRNRTGPRDVNRIARPTTRKIGSRRGSAMSTQVKSKRRFNPHNSQELGLSGTRLREKRAATSDFRREGISAYASEIPSACSGTVPLKDEFSEPVGKCSFAL